MAKSEGGGMSAGAIIGIIAGVVVCGGVVVVGILAAIAVPNFMKFQCKAKQSEAKTNLSSLFTAEKAFYGEYDTYTTDLVSLSWAPFGTPSYLYGFAEAGTKASKEARAIEGFDPSRRATDDTRVQTANPYFRTTKMNNRGMPLDASMLPGDTTSTKDHFLAGAVGNIDGDGTLDIWTIDETRNLTTVSNDCTR